MSDTTVSADADFDDDFSDSSPIEGIGKALDVKQSDSAEPFMLRVPTSVPADRLDKVLASLLPEHSRNRLQGWIEAGKVHVNGAPGKIRQSVGAGDMLTVWAQPAPEVLAFAPEPVAFQVVEASQDWIVVYKPAGLVTHPGAGNWHGTLLNGLLYRYPELAQVARAGIVHRLDKDTSGLMVVARHALAQTHLVRQLQARTMGREYLALAHGWLKTSGRVDRQIGRDSRVPIRMSVERPVAPKPAVTHYTPLKHGEAADAGRVTALVCRLETGRTHQIRVHLASLGHPLLADTIYGGKAAAGAQRQMLHAQALHFDDPGGGGTVRLTASMPADMAAVQEQILWNA